MFVESVFAQYKKVLFPALKATRDRIEKIDKKSMTNMVDETFEVKARNKRSGMPWLQPVKFGEEAAKMRHVLQDATEAMNVLEDAIRSLSKKAHRRNFILDGATKTFPTRPSRELLLELAIREKLGGPSQANWKQLGMFFKLTHSMSLINLAVSSPAILNLDFGPRKTPFLVVDEKVFNDDLTPKMYFVSADDTGGDWILGSTQPSCGKWLFNTHIFMEKVRNHQLGPAYEFLYRKLQGRVQEFERAKVETAQEVNAALPEADQLKHRVLLGEVRQGLIEEFHKTGEALGMFSMTGLAFTRDLTYSMMCMRCQYIHGYKEVMDFDPVTTKTHYQSYNWDHRVQKALSCAEAATALQCAIKRRDDRLELWDRKLDEDLMEL